MTATLDRQYDPETFGGFLHGQIQARGMSRNQVAHLAGIDTSYITRAVHGTRTPPRLHILESLARVLRLAPYEANRLYVLGGCAPRIDDWSPVLQAVTDVLSDPMLSEAEIEEYRALVLAISRKWRATG